MPATSLSAPAPAPAYDLAIFDFDGTLADSFPPFLEGLNAAAARYGFRAIDEEDVNALRGCSPWEVMERIDVALWQVPMITQFVRRHVAGRLDKVTLFPGIHETLEDLAAAGVRLAIVSSNSEAAIRHVLGARLASLVHDFRCSVSIFGKRPRLRQALAATGVDAARAVAIGDEVRDLRAARGEGMACGGVAWGFTALPALAAADPDHLFARVEDIAPALCPGGRRPTPPAPRA